MCLAISKDDTPDSSATREFSVPNPYVKHPRNWALLFLNIPPQDETLGFPLAAPSQLHLIQFRMGGFQITSLTILAFRGLIFHLKAFNIENSIIEELAEKNCYLPKKKH